MKYRATCTILFNFESDLPYEQALELAKQHLDDIPMKEGIDDIRTILQLDKLKSKVEKIKLGEFTLDEVIPFITNDPERKEYKVKNTIYQVKMNTDRYHVFKNNMFCVSCGLEGTKLLLECYPADMIPHFNLYGEEDNKLVLFTKDHITAKAFGGEDTLDNFQTMCSTCNTLKAHSNLTVDSVAKLRKAYDENRKKIGKKKLHVLIENERLKLEQPWPHLIYKNDSKPANAVQCLFNMVMFEDGNEMIAVPEKELPESIVVRGYIEKDTYLEEILEINNKSACKLSDLVVIIAKEYLAK
jgi:hypothetical protein